LKDAHIARLYNWIFKAEKNGNTIFAGIAAINKKVAII
jgi:hypothetical protein